ncbi:branched-chain amino acid ABC transporter permease [Pseudohoeflea sp. DP4N28-3]|uniref:Branched-chain amino acid ABC transporter permease n=2 Tax=Pseudohoeflea coraliihabitans TaxID=2860393 RepID=A0ABS6WS97_9HYPH|nr:branched-chain amino acid ABC transporter permease [Pseudohoeflea sp. DP4N28-3]
MFYQTRAKNLTVLLVLGGLALYAVYGGYFAREIVVEIALLAMLAIALDLVAGYGGMISLCHGALFGIGAYLFGGLTALVGTPVWLATLAALAGTALFGWAVGAVTAGIGGIFFIMATLAFGQMAYVIVFEWRALGGDDGLAGIPRTDLAGIGLDTGDSLTFALLSLAALALSYTIAAIALRSSFGRTLTGIHANEERMRALGLNVRRHKAAAFALSAAIAGAAGLLAAQHTQYISPEYLVWTVSGEALIVVILGGIGTLAGPLVGAVVFVALEHVVARFTDYWHLVIGILLIAAVMAGGRGLYGEIERLLAPGPGTGKGGDGA